MNYHIYIVLKIFNNNLYSNFFKSLTSFFIRSNSKIKLITDYGNYFNQKKIKRLFYLNIDCKKTTLNKILKLFKIKKDIIFNFIILKNNINFYIEYINNINSYVSQNFKIISSIIKNIKYKQYKHFSKTIKNLKILSIIPNNFISYIKKINILYD
ncbi:hypothetical protein [Candidatus Carsonella ruddii]|uniref:hypothetical protein n=1 Tax=Carsonella ruddii TaxID=114186 RepID=UPI003D817046